MSLQTIADAVASLMPGTAYETGLENVRKEAAPPRVAWVPTTDSYGPADVRAQNTNPRTLATCTRGVDVHLWGTDLAATEGLRDTFVSALRATIGPNFALTGGRWIGQDLVALGRVYVLSLTIATPVLETALQTTTVTSEPQDVAFNPSPPHA